MVDQGFVEDLLMVSIVLEVATQIKIPQTSSSNMLDSSSTGRHTLHCTDYYVHGRFGIIRSR